jgi:hypothetical protein
MGRPTKYRRADGTPVRRAGQRVLTSVDETGRAHDLLTIDESCALLHANKELISTLVGAGVIRVAASASNSGTRLYSKLDLEAVASQLFGDRAEAARNGAPLVGA